MSATSPSTALIGIIGIARRLVLDGHLSEADARRAQEEAGKARKTVPDWLVEKKLISSARVAAANAAEFGMPLLDLGSLDLKQAPIKLVSEQTMTTHQILPLFKRGNRLYVGTADPTNTRGLDEVRFQTNLSIEAILTDAEQLRRGIETALAASEEFTMDDADDEGLEDLEASAGDDDEDDSGGIDARGDDTPVVRFVNKMLVDAIKRGASDIHFEPYENEYRVRYRMDGILRTVAKPPLKLNPRISSRIKVITTKPIINCINIYKLPTHVCTNKFI